MEDGKNKMEPIKVIYEDNHILVVEKLVNIPSQADKTEDKDMLSLLKEYIKEKYHKPGEVYLALVHRLDRPVGGVMVFAKTSKAAARLSEQVRNRTIKKSYLAIIDGTMEQRDGVLEDYLLKKEKTNTSKVVDKSNKNAKLAKLSYKTLKIEETINLSVVEIQLQTGRHHQIRVQFAAKGHSLYGDQKYGTRGRGKQIALWAYKLTIIHPITKEEMTFTDFPNPIGSWKIIEDLGIG